MSENDKPSKTKVGTDCGLFLSKDLLEATKGVRNIAKDYKSLTFLIDTKKLRDLFHYEDISALSEAIYGPRSNPGRQRGGLAAFSEAICEPRSDRPLENENVIESRKLLLRSVINPNYRLELNTSTSRKALSKTEIHSFSIVGYSGLLAEPKKKDAWFDVIDDMTKEFYEQFGHLPKESQAISQLWRNPPKGYEISLGQERGEDCLFLPGVSPLSISGFKKRWKNYTSVRK